MSRKQKHIDVIVSHLLRDDQGQALRYYIENRVSYSSFTQARTIAAMLKRRAEENNGLIFPQKRTDTRNHP